MQRKHGAFAGVNIFGGRLGSWFANVTASAGFCSEVDADVDEHHYAARDVE